LTVHPGDTFMAEGCKELRARYHVHHATIQIETGAYPATWRRTVWCALRALDVRAVVVVILIFSPVPMRVALDDQACLGRRRLERGGDGGVLDFRIGLVTVSTTEGKLQADRLSL